VQLQNKAFDAAALQSVEGALLRSESPISSHTSEDHLLAAPLPGQILLTPDPTDLLHSVHVHFQSLSERLERRKTDKAVPASPSDKQQWRELHQPGLRSNH
jgi:hypothetical protein